jgi:hypothetical protein
MRIRINHIPRYDDYGEMPSNENLLLFFYAGRPLSKKCKGGEDTWQKSNADMHVSICYLTVMNWDLLFSKYNINMLFLNNFSLILS